MRAGAFEGGRRKEEVVGSGEGGEGRGVEGGLKEGSSRKGQLITSELPPKPLGF